MITVVLFFTIYIFLVIMCSCSNNSWWYIYSSGGFGRGGGLGYGSAEQFEAERPIHYRSRGQRQYRRILMPTSSHSISSFLLIHPTYSSSTSRHNNFRTALESQSSFILSVISKYFTVYINNRINREGYSSLGLLVRVLLIFNTVDSDMERMVF